MDAWLDDRGSEEGTRLRFSAVAEQYGEAL